MLNLKTPPLTQRPTPLEALTWFQNETFHTTPPYFLTHWKTGKKFFYFNNALLAYEETSNSLIIAGEPLTKSSESTNSIFKKILEYAHTLNKKVCGYYVGPSWKQAGFIKSRLGVSFYLQPKKFDITLPSSAEIRRSLKKGRERHYKYKLITDKIHFLNYEAQGLFKMWKKSKGPLALKFLLSNPSEKHLASSFENWIAVFKEGTPIAFCSTLPYLKNNRKGIYIDNLIHKPSSESHALSFLLSSLILDSKNYNIAELNLGLSPFAEISSSDPLSRVFKSLYNNKFFYKPRGIYSFKKKFSGLKKNEYFFSEESYSKIYSLWEMAKVSLSFRNTSSD